MTVTPILPETTPRSLELLLQAVRVEVPCPHCGARPGTGCAYQGRRGVHLNRFVRAYTTYKITVDEIARVLGSREVFTMATIIRDGDR